MKQENNTNELCQYLERYFDWDYPSIPKQSCHSSFLSENENININEKNHYLCKECKTLHLINIIYEEKKVNEDSITEEKIVIEEKISLECNKKGKISLEKFLADTPFIENFDNYKLCQTHIKKEKIGFCSKCKKDLCQKCREVKDCENKQRHAFVEFKIKNKEISEKEKFILDVLKKKYNDVIKIKSETSEISEEKRRTNNFTETLGDLVSLCQFIEALENSKDKIPSYIHYQNIINIYHYLCDKLKIHYHCFINNKTKIRLFGEIFIKNNLNKCSVIINNELKKIEDCEFYELKVQNTDLNIILLKEDDIIDMSYMFNDCEDLKFIFKDSKWNTNNVINMSYMFYNCKTLSSFPTFFCYCDTSKVTDMSNLFNGCESLREIKDISYWDTSEVENMCKMFYGCKLLKNLKNILIWDTKNVIDMSYMFYNCSKLKSIDTENENGIKWNTEKVENMSYMFYGCESLEQLPDNIASWGINEVVYMMYMFCNCKSLVKLPDISNWKTPNVSYMNNMFENCSSLESLPDITKWNIKSLIDISFLIDGCISLESFPDLSNWDKIAFKKGKLFEKCFPNKKIIGKDN